MLRPTLLVYLAASYLFSSLPGALAEQYQELKSIQDAFDLDLQEDMKLIGLHAGSKGECSDELDTFKHALEEMQNVVDVVLVGLQGDEISKAADRYGSEIATLEMDRCQIQLVLLPFGKDKEDLDEYQVWDGPMEGKALQTFVTSFMPDHFSPEIMPETWEAFMMDGKEGLQSPEDDEEEGEDLPLPPTPPKVLLVTNKDHVPGVLKALSLRFRNTGLGFGYIRAHDEQNKPIVDQLGPGKVPRLLLLLPLPPSPKTHGQGQISVQPFTGSMRYSNMFTWLQQMASVLDNVMGGSNKMTVDIPQLTTDDHFHKHCVSKGGGVCVVGLIDLEQSGGEKLVKMMGKVAGKSREQPFYFSYVDAPRHKSFLAPFSVGHGNLPTAVAFSAARMRYAVLPERMSEPADLTRFIDGVLGGRVKTLPLEVLPSLDVSASSGDSLDAEEHEALIQEEFDLSEIMSEEVEPSFSKEERMRQVEAELKEQAEAAKKKVKKSKKGGSKSEL